jgi:hypothetical protein
MSSALGEKCGKQGKVTKNPEKGVPVSALLGVYREERCRVLCVSWSSYELRCSIQGNMNMKEIVTDLALGLSPFSSAE